MAASMVSDAPAKDPVCEAMALTASFDFPGFNKITGFVFS